MEYSEKIERDDQFSNDPAGLAQRWSTEIEASRKELNRFHDDAERILKRYLDKRDDWGREESRVNLFWSTMKVMLSMLYARPPKADVSRTFQDFDDDEARVAGQILQRILNKGFEDDVSEWDIAVRQGIEDWLIVGLGQMWLRYEVETEEVPEVIDAATGIVIPASERIVDEDACCDYVHWKDFFWSPARTWNEVRWVARRIYMTQDQLEARFGEKISRIVPLQDSKATKEGQQPQYDPWARAEVFEIWCKEHKKVYWLAKGADTILDVKDDPLGLSNFFPCPRPLVANVTTSNFMPRADYVFAQDQFNELDEINTRISWLTRAAKVAGVYDKAAGDSVGRMFQQAAENQLIPVDNWAMFAEAGGVKGKVDFAPIDQIVNCIERLRVYRADKTQQIYEVLGVSDIMRGSSNASETATAQQIKAQFGSTRMQLMQFYIAQWISDGLRIKAEIICKHWQPQTMVERSNILRTPDANFAQNAIALLKNEQVAQYRINVEADSMAALDWAAERDAAVQFMQGLGAFVSQTAPMAQQVPEAGPYLLRMMQWAVSKFRVSTQIESVLDQAVAGMQQKLQTPPSPPQPDPDTMVKAQIEAEKIKSQERIAAMEAQSDQQIAALKATMELQKIEMKAKMDQMAAQFQQFQSLLAMQMPGEQMDKMASAIQEGNAANQVTQQQLAALTQQVARKRKRVPIRDDNGDILEVREVDDDEDDAVPRGMARLPQPMPAMGGM